MPVKTVSEEDYLLIHTLLSRIVGRLPRPALKGLVALTGYGQSTLNRIRIATDWQDFQMTRDKGIQRLNMKYPRHQGTISARLEAIERLLLNNDH